MVLRPPFRFKRTVLPFSDQGGNVCETVAAMKKTVIIKFFLVAGFLFVVAGLYQYDKISEFAAAAVEARGTVIGMERSSNGTSKPVVEWTDHTGIPRILYSNAGSNPPGFFEGEQVTVLYSPDDPKYPVTARIDSTFQLWGLPIFLVCFGAAWMLIASLTWYVHAKGDVIYFDGEHDAEIRRGLV